MAQKLNCVIVDDDPFTHAIVEDLCKESQYVKLVSRFKCPKQFLDSVSDLDFDLCLLDIMMPLMDGFTVAKIIKDKQIVFITGVYEEVPDALKFSPLDVILKPILKERFEKVMQKAYHIRLGEKAVGLSNEKKTHELFLVAELLGKVKVPLSSIIYVKTDDIDYRNKIIHLNDGKKYTIMDYSFDELIELSPQLMQVNRSEVIAVNIFRNIEHDTITLHEPNAACVLPRQVTLSRRFRKKVFQRVAFA